MWNGLIEYLAKSNPAGSGGQAPLGPAFFIWYAFGCPWALSRVKAESTA